MIRLFTALFIFSLSTPSLACETPSFDELKSFFEKSSWIEVDKDNKLVTHKTISADIKFKNPKESTIKLGSRSLQVTKICKLNGGFRVYSGIRSVKLTRSKKHLYVSFLGVTYSLLPTDSKLLIKAANYRTASRHQKQLKDKIERIFFKKESSFELNIDDLKNDRAIDI